ncbi:MAG: M23 family metallopeptidase [Candidatus Saganbacteria bacterium]|nr:M23 family metallopeptidase [Candidatus Saganbacteria bacterium]
MKRHFFIFLLCLFCSSSFCAVAAELVVDPEIAWQGKIITIRLVSIEAEQVSGQFLNQEFYCYRSGDDYYGVVGVPVNQKTGYYDLDLIVTRKDGQTQAITRTLKVWATKFPFSKFWLPPARSKLRAKEIVEDEWAQIEKLLLVEDKTKNWDGRFLMPAQKRISQGFGHRQIINGKRNGNHRGVDIAVLSGTEIMAPNGGKVVFVKKLKAFGGTIVLDHGQGIHTLYFHLSKFMAEVGDEIKKGETIALSGNSGVSSGAHLHWGMSVHNLRVDPMQWVRNEI